jgi:hypothetical protein
MSTPPDEVPSDDLADENDKLRAANKRQKELADALSEATSEIKRQNDFAESVVAAKNLQLAKALADIIRGQIEGMGEAGKKFREQEDEDS